MSILVLNKESKKMLKRLMDDSLHTLIVGKSLINSGIINLISLKMSAIVRFVC